MMRCSPENNCALQAKMEIPDAQIAAKRGEDEIMKLYYFCFETFAGGGVRAVRYATLSFDGEKCTQMSWLCVAQI
jgi:hypothetical protein